MSITEQKFNFFKIRSKNIIPEGNIFQNFCFNLSNTLFGKLHLCIIALTSLNIDDVVLANYNKHMINKPGTVVVTSCPGVDVKSVTDILDSC